MKKKQTAENKKQRAETFADLCKELGHRTNSTENALLCYRAHQAYLVEHPDTARGKANKTDRDPKSIAFRTAAAEVSGVAPATIDALLQVGKAIDPLPSKTKAALVSSSLGNSMRLLRKLATKKYDKDRASLIVEFVGKEKIDTKSAMSNLKNKLGLRSAQRENVEAKMAIRPESHFFLPGEHLDVKVGRYLFRVEVGEIASGRIHLTAMALTGEKKQVDKFLESVSARPDPAKVGSKLLTAAKKAAA